MVTARSLSCQLKEYGSLKLLLSTGEKSGDIWRLSHGCFDFSRRIVRNAFESISTLSNMTWYQIQQQVISSYYFYLQYNQGIWHITGRNHAISSADNLWRLRVMGAILELGDVMRYGYDILSIWLSNLLHTDIILDLPCWQRSHN